MPIHLAERDEYIAARPPPFARPRPVAYDAWSKAGPWRQYSMDPLGSSGCTPAAVYDAQGEAFAGLSVAITTPFRDGEVDYAALCASRSIFRSQAGTQVPVPGRHDGRISDATHEEHERVIAAVVEIAAGRIKVMPGTGSNSTAEALRLTKSCRQGRRRRGAGRRPLLQQADAGRLLSALQGPGRSGRHSDLRLQHSRPHRQEHRARNDRPHGRAAEHHDGQGGDRFDGPGLADPGPDESDRAQRRRQPDACRLLSIGGRGVISVVGNIVPRDMLALLKAFDAGDADTAPASGTASCFRCAATCWGWRRTRFRSRRPCDCWAATPANCACR